MTLQVLVYHVFGLKGLEDLTTEYVDEKVMIHVQTNEEHFHCASRKCKDVLLMVVLERRFRTVMVGLTPVFLYVCIRRLHCQTLTQTPQEHFKFALGIKVHPFLGKPCTESIRRYAMIFIHFFTVSTYEFNSLHDMYRIDLDFYPVRVVNFCIGFSISPATRPVPMCDYDLERPIRFKEYSSVGKLPSINLS